MNLKRVILGISCFISFRVGAEAFPRKVLALYDAKNTKDIIHTAIHRHAEVILNHLGLEVVYHSVDEPLPKPDQLKSYSGVLSWFQNGEGPQSSNLYCQWLTTQVLEGRKVVILGELGFRSCESFFKAWGVLDKQEMTEDPYVLNILKEDPQGIGFERKLLLTEGLKYRLFLAPSKESHAYLKVVRRDLDNSVSDLVFTFSKGGLAYGNTPLFEWGNGEKIQWRLNPFLFFEEAFGTAGIPKPDVTTMNGLRVFYTHIDGDGFLNRSHIDQQSYSGEVILQEILERTPQIPITASIIAGYLDMKEFQSERIFSLYEKMFRLPNVEVASHGYAHPLKWREGKLALQIPGYVYSDEREIKGSVQRLKHFLESRHIVKPVKLFLWTGDCLPNEEQLRIADSILPLSMNGRDSRFDERYKSFAFLYPLGILRGKSRQIYASASNENIYTNLWKGPFFGFREVVETFANTESPIRIKPVNIYYHFYSGERLAALKVLQDVYVSTLRQDVFPIFASEYVQMVQDFFATQVGPLGEGYRVTTNGFLKTIRLDHEKRNVDLKRSTGILGFNHFQDSLYVFLDDHQKYEIYLTTQKPSQPYLIRASFHLSSWKGDRAKLEFFKEGWHQSFFKLGGLTPQTLYHIETAQENFNVQTDKSGHLDVHFATAENGAPPVKVIVRRHD